MPTFAANLPRVAHRALNPRAMPQTTHRPAVSHRVGNLTAPNPLAGNSNAPNRHVINSHPANSMIAVANLLARAIIALSTQTRAITNHSRHAANTATLAILTMIGAIARDDLTTILMSSNPQTTRVDEKTTTAPLILMMNRTNPQMVRMISSMLHWVQF